ncbi:VOC family protein [Phenylobacterium sp.]|uniref:VOC family protein n=1 Tax=Phenylobacterium sp. TaxID=1871053 RepID=UPI0035AEF326
MNAPNAEAQLISPIKLAHVVLRTGQAESVVAWYCTVLNARVVLSNPMISFLTYDDEHHRVAIIQRPGVTPAPTSSAGLEHVAFTYRGADELFATYERLASQGIRPYWTINHGPTLSFYYRDPDGNQVELQIDLFDTDAALAAWFVRSDFAANPIGVKFNADDLIRRYRAGEPARSLFERPLIDPAQVPAQLPAGNANLTPTPIG